MRGPVVAGCADFEPWEDLPRDFYGGFRWGCLGVSEATYRFPRHFVFANETSKIDH